MVGLADTVMFVPMYTSGQYYEEIDFYKEVDVDRINLPDLVKYAGNLNLNTRECARGATLAVLAKLNEDGCIEICSKGTKEVKDFGICDCSAGRVKFQEL